MQYVNASINAVGFNTPGAASSAADFGRVLGGVWEAKILDFRTFFDGFSMSFFKRASEGEKIEKKCEKKQTFPLFGVGFAVVPRPVGKGKDRGKNTSGRIARKNV